MAASGFFRKLHRKTALIIFLPLLISALTLTFGDTIIAANVVEKVKETAMKYLAEAVIAPHQLNDQLHS